MRVREEDKGDIKLKCRYSGTSLAFEYLILSLFVGVPLFIKITAKLDKQEFILLMLLASVIYILIDIIVQTIPCTISADRKGFSIKVLGVSRYYSYDSLSGIECEIARNRIGKTAIILVITEESGKVTKYCEKLGIVPEDADMKSISRLIKFCRYAEKKIG